MKVTLIDYTVEAAEKLVFTKSTRLKMTPDLAAQVSLLSPEELLTELEYMTNTIKSSWEFVNYTFVIEGVSRAFTHQFVRNRQGSYAQQTMRILDVEGFEYVTGPSVSISPEAIELYESTMESINNAYRNLISLGVEIEDARGVLPTNICTNIVAQYNLRTLSELVQSRSSVRTQGEFRNVMNLMYEEIVKVHPWAAMFLKGKKTEALRVLESAILDKYEGTAACTGLVKQIDILRRG